VEEIKRRNHRHRTERQQQLFCQSINELEEEKEKRIRKYTDPTDAGLHTLLPLRNG